MVEVERVMMNLVASYVPGAHQFASDVKPKGRYSKATDDRRLICRIGEQGIPEGYARTLSTLARCQPP